MKLIDLLGCELRERHYYLPCPCQRQVDLINLKNQQLSPKNTLNLVICGLNCGSIMTDESKSYPNQ